MGIESVSDLGLIEGGGMTCLAKTLLDYFGNMVTEVKVRYPRNFPPMGKRMNHNFKMLKTEQKPRADPFFCPATAHSENSVTQVRLA
ncbi:MAG: hypothetical protein ABFS18_12495 [Thermodesulfobacteriota bacterium]